MRMSGGIKNIYGDGLISSDILYNSVPVHYVSICCYTIVSE